MTTARKYDAWGKHRGETEPSTESFKLDYTGHQFDVETGLTYARARYYDSDLGRFISRDSHEGISSDAPSLHRYVYARVNPLLYVDLNGHDPTVNPFGGNSCDERPITCADAMYTQDSARTASRLSQLEDVATGPETLPEPGFQPMSQAEMAAEAGVAPNGAAATSESSLPWWKVAFSSLASAFTSPEDRQRELEKQWTAAQEQARATAAQRSKEIAALVGDTGQIIVEKQDAPGAIPRIAPAPSGSNVPQSMPALTEHTVSLPGLPGEAMVPESTSNETLVAPGAADRNNTMDVSASGSKKNDNNGNTQKRPSIRSRIRDAGLPGGTNESGPFRYRPPKGYKPGNPLPTAPGGGYIDRFENVWQEGPYHGDPQTGFTYEWDVQLTKSGMSHWNKKDPVKGYTDIAPKKYINVAPDGTLSH